MSDEAAPKKKDEGSGAPAWVMTFADLMSLLMCFFVLLLSFAEMDLLKFKQIAGSMKNAFGVQREVKVKEMPKGTSVIAQEFSPGRPTPTAINEVRQNTVDENKQTVEFTDATTEKDSDSTGEEADNREQAAVMTVADTEEATEETQMEKFLKENQLEEELIALSTMVADMSQEMEKMAEKLDEKDLIEEVKQQAIQVDEKVAEIMELNKDKNELPGEVDNEQTKADAQKLLQALEPEIKKGLVSVETDNNKILLRIKEKGSFPSGSSIMKGGFLPVIEKLKVTLLDIEGDIIVAGHTDNVPIKTKRFRSNWELSSSRAVTVVHELLNKSRLNPRRFSAEGHGSAKPIAPNNTVENRALNRRVEMTIVQGGKDEESEISQAVEETETDDGNTVTDSAETTVTDPDQTALIDQQPLPEGEVPGVEDKQKIEEEIDKQQEEPVDAVEFKSKLQQISDSLKKQETGADENGTR